MNSAWDWDSGQLDLDAYLRRVEYQGERTASVASLHTLHRAHVLHIPFENLEIIAGRPIKLDVASLERKMVHQRRGGYCFEHATLFGTALAALGFGVEGFLGRVRLGQEPGKQLPETHAVLRVTTPDTGQRWFSDVGFGASALAPAEFVDGAEVAAAGRKFRLIREDDRVWVWQEIRGAQTVDSHASTIVPRFPIDYQVSNHYVSTWPTSPFVARPYATRMTESGLSHKLDGVHYSALLPDGTQTDQHTWDPEEVPKVLEGIFGIELDAEDQSKVVQHLREWVTR